ncbi:DUF2877 domain-containing protein [Paenibacillus sp. GCM10027629]|uniref:DUF2877 domain-containing protein n=1 Tax=Paenibacillus sp. GCM10027629 TaxID=3273414 RepID=UPI00362A2925
MRIHHARSCDLDWINQLQHTTFHGYVHSVFDRTINVECSENGELYTLACQHLDNAPNTMLIDMDRFSELAIKVNDMVYADQRIVHIGDQLSIAMDQVTTWECQLPFFPNNIGSVINHLAFTKEIIEQRGKCGGMKPDLTRSSIFEQETSRLLSERSLMLQEALLQHRVSDALRHAAGLIGLGPGLTPSGDDFLVGLLSTFHMENSPGRIYQGFGEKIVDVARTLTNEISYTALKQASKGRVRESITRLLHSITCGKQEELILSLDKVLNIGSSSGTDIVYGIVCGLEINIKAGGTVCPQKL